MSSSRTLWSIGDESLDPRQFSERWFSDDRRGPDFHVGTSCAGADWPRIQPGPLNAATGFQPTEAAVVFEVDESTAAEPTEVVADFFASHGPCPQLELDVNGHRGLFFPEVVRDQWHDGRTRPSPIAGAVHLSATLPSGVLRAGTNRLTVRTVAVEAPAPEECRPASLPHLRHWFGSAITWRRLALRSTSAAPARSTRCQPLPLYVRDGDELRELVDVVIRIDDRFERASVRLVIGEAEYTGTVERDERDFGDFRCRLAVAETDAPAAARLDVRVDDAVASQDFTFRPARKWTLHLLPHVHLDVGYTDLQAKVIELHSRNLERAEGILARRPDYAFTVDGSLTVHEYLRTRGSAGEESVLAALAADRLAVNAFSVLFLSGLASLEETFRSAYRGLTLRDEHETTVQHAHLTDVPSYSWAIPTVLRALGLDSFIGIQNHGRGGNADSDELHLASPVRWVGADGADVLAFFSDSYSQLRFLGADPPTVAGMADGFVRYLRRYERADYLPHDLPVVGTHTDNEDLGDGYADVVDRWNRRYAYPRLVFDTFPGYLASVAPLRDRLPVVHGDGGSYWEDGAGTLAVAVERYRAAQVQLAAAEAVCTLAAASYAGVRPDLATLDAAWDDLLYGCEHTWTAAHATHRPHAPSSIDGRDWKMHQIERAWRLAVDETRRGLSQLAELLAVRAPALIVFNPTAETRDLTAVHELPEHSRLSLAGESSAEGIAVEVLEFAGVAGAQDGYVLGRFAVPDVPAFGYRVIGLRTCAEPLRASPEDRPGTVRTPRYEIRVDAGTGRLVGLVHRALDVELLDRGSAHALAEVVYVTGGGDAADRGIGAQMTSLYDDNPDLPAPLLTMHPARMTYVGHRRTPTGDLLTFRGSAPTVPDIRTEIRFFDESDRVEVSVRLRKSPELAKESVYVAFPFAVPEPTLRYDRQLGWVDPAADSMVGACHDWFCAQNGAAVTNGALSITWASADAPLFVADDVVRGRWATSSHPRTGTLMSWVMNNYWWTNTPASQSGEVTFRYAFVPTREWDQTAASRFVRSLRAAETLAEVSYQDRIVDGEPVVAGPRGSLLETDLPANVDAHVYAARRRTGLVVRLEEIGGRDAHARIRHPAPGGTAELCTADETPLEPLPVHDGRVSVALGPNSVRTVVLWS